MPQNPKTPKPQNPFDGFCEFKLNKRMSVVCKVWNLNLKDITDLFIDI